ncbi:MAG: hypothetical protein CMJ75_02830 [Planctomycetaceae bacterium]|nr:hypothetical protein [Planctomycetaceae bacterium]
MSKFERQNLRFTSEDDISPLISMLKGNIPIKTIIDIGCADGTFSLTCLLINPNFKILNIDAQTTYEENLNYISQKLGGYHRITGLSSFSGKMKFGLLPDHEQSMPYWFGNSGKKSDEEIDCTTLDLLMEELDLPTPYFIRMDIENSEFHVLQGATATLTKTAGIILEQHTILNGDAGNFLDRCNFLASRGFTLFDILRRSYHPTQPAYLMCFFPVFLNSKYDFRYKQKQDISEEKANVLQMQKRLEQERESKIQINQEIIEYILTKQKV